MSVRGSAGARALTLVSGSALAVLLCAAGPATAEGGGSLLIDIPGDGLGFLHATSVPMIAGPTLAPGGTTTGSVRVLNDADHDSRLDVSVVDVAEAENGCLPPETAAGDTTCAEGGGELGPRLQVSVSETGPAGPLPLWSGPFPELAAGADLHRTMAPGEVIEVVLTFSLPADTGNETMTDTVGFDLRLTASADISIVSPPKLPPNPPNQPAGPHSGAGHTHDPSGVLDRVSGLLPNSGSRAGSLLVVADLMLLTLGSALWLLARRRRARAGDLPV